MKLYSLDACERLIDNYVNNAGGQLTQIEEGTLGLGKLLLHGAIGKKSIIIQEVFLNGWSSGHKIRMFNKLPKKYANAII